MPCRYHLNLESSTVMVVSMMQISQCRGNEKGPAGGEGRWGGGGAHQEGTGGTALGSQLIQRSGLRPKAVTGATALSFTFLQKVWEAGSNSCVMGLAVSRKSLHHKHSTGMTCIVDKHTT